MQNKEKSTKCAGSDERAELCARIAAARKATGMTRIAASKALGIPLRTLENWEYGANAPASYLGEAIIEKLSKWHHKPC